LNLAQSGPNRNAIGSWVEVRMGDRTIEREVTVGGGHVGGQLGWVHIGLGEHEQVDLRVQWPDGEVSPWNTVNADQFLLVEHDAGTVTPWVPGSELPAP
jgi:hypothetical protein